MDLEPLLQAYRAGVFPMAEPGTGEMYWFDPDPRGIIPLEPGGGDGLAGGALGGLRVSRSLRSVVRSGRFRVTSDEAFGDVIRACAAPRAGQDADEAGWIDARIVRWYEALHDAGHAHSVEAWVIGEGGERTLVGGLYGVAVDGLFAGESMFSRPDVGGTDASKVCLVHLVAHLIARGYTLLDTQFGTDHLARLGGVEISRDAYHTRLAEALTAGPTWGELDPSRAAAALSSGIRPRA